jgi:hypothetical protein
VVWNDTETNQNNDDNERKPCSERPDFREVKSNKTMVRFTIPEATSRGMQSAQAIVRERFKVDSLSAEEGESLKDDRLWTLKIQYNEY